MPAGAAVPEPWASAMEQVGAVSPRTGVPSMSKLGQMSGIHPTTVQRIVFNRAGGQGPDAESIEKLAHALKKAPATVAAWCGQSWLGQGPYTPPKEANRLSPRSRRLIDEMIRHLAAAESRADQTLMAG